MMDRITPRISLNVIIILVFAAMIELAPADAQLAPDPAHSPEAVVRAQLEALQRNDVPEANAGINQAWTLAHPDNKRVTGPLWRFERMIRGPFYRSLIDHVGHELNRLSAGKDEVVFQVLIETPSGEVVEYRWAVGKVGSGPEKGAWMTTKVSPPGAAGRKT